MINPHPRRITIPTEELMLDELERITTIVCEVGKIAHVGPDDDFYDAGFSSINALELLLQLEDACEVSIPDDQFITARTARDLAAIIVQLRRVLAA
jgi:acyl carrier protein